MGTCRNTHFKVLKELIAYIFANILLSLLGGPANMRGQHHIGQMLQRRNETISVFFRFNGIYIDSSSAYLLLFYCLFQCLQVNYLSSCVLDKDGALLKLF